MSEYSDIAGSDDIISLNYDTQETFNENSFRIKQTANRNEKTSSNEDCLKNQAKENQKPIEKVIDDDIEVMQTDTETNGVSHEQPSSLTDAQNSLPLNNPFVIQPPVAQSTLTDDNSISVAKDSLPIESQVQEEEKNSVDNELTTNSKIDSNGFDTLTTANNLRLYVSPSTSLLETTNPEDAQSNNGNNITSEIEEIEKPKDEPMETTDAQVSLGSDGMIESNPTLTNTNTNQTTTVEENLTADTPSPIKNKTSISPTSKVLSSLSQPNLDKFEKILAKITPSPTRQTGSINGDKTNSNITIQEEEEELVIKESITKSIRRYTIKIDSSGRTVSRDLLDERVVEENTTIRIESWPTTENKVIRRSITKPTRTVEPSPKKLVTKRRTTSLKPTSTSVSSKKSKAVQSDKDESSDDNEKIETINEVNDNDDDELPTDNVTGEEFVPLAKKSSDQTARKGLRVFARWVDGHYYPGTIGNINGEKYSIDYDDGAKRYVKCSDIILQDYLEPNQNVITQNPNGQFKDGIVKRLIKKKKSSKLGYVVEIDNKEKWYPIRFISLTFEQAEHLPFMNKTINGETLVIHRRKRKRTSNIPQSPNKKTKSSITISPNKNPRTSFTPTRKTKLFNSMYFLLTGFNDLMDVRHKTEDSIESHGGKVIEKMPNPNRRDNVYVISDIARRTAKFLEAKKANIPAVNYKWIEESVEKGELQNYECYQLVLPEKETKKNHIQDDDED